MNRVKKELPKYKHAWPLLYFFIYLPWFLILEQKITPDYAGLHIIHCPLDDIIPFCEWFVIPYLIWFLYIPAVFLFLFYHSKKEFYIPSNVFLVATMNTADRSLDTIDYAIRRRFAFITVKPQEIDDDNFNSELFREVSSLFISNYDEYAESGFDDTIKLLPAETLSEEYRPEDVWIGHSYFIMDGEYALQDRLLFEIIPLLEEYIRDGVLTSEAQQTIDKLYLTATEQ